MSTALHHARRRLAHTGEHITLTTRTRTQTVDPATGQHTFTSVAAAQNVPAIIIDGGDQSGNGSRNVDDQRDIAVRTLEIRVEAGTPVDVGQHVEIVDSHDAQMVGVSGTVTGVNRSGRMFRRFSVTTVTAP